MKSDRISLVFYMKADNLYMVGMFWQSGNDISLNKLQQNGGGADRNTTKILHHTPFLLFFRSIQC